MKAEYSKPRNTVTELRSSFDVLPKFFFGIGASLDRDLLLDVLRVPVLGLPNATPSTTPSPAPTPIPITPPAPPRKEYIVMDDANGWGMNNKSDTPLPYLPFNMEVTMVYAVHETLYNSKAKVKEYDPLDFNLNNELVFSFHTEGLEYEVIDGHKLTLEINKHEFFIEITGFPESKRVIATVEYKESGEEDGI